MNNNLIINTLSKKNNGAFFNLTYCTDLPLTAQAKRDGITAIKITRGTYRKGIGYANMKSVQEKVANGKVLTHVLPWGEWVPEHEGVLISHNGKTFLRLYMTPNKPKSEYMLNGKVVTRAEMETAGVIQPSYWKKTGDTPDCITINTANVQEIV